MPLFFILLIPVAIFIALHFLKNRSKSLHFIVIGISLAVLFASQINNFNKNQFPLILILTLIIFGNFYRNQRKTTP